MARRARANDSVPSIEWITGLASLVLVLGTLGFLAVHAVQQRDPLPDLRLHVDTVARSASQPAVTVVVRNVSQQAAAGVTIQGSVVEGRGKEVRAEAHLDYVPGLSERRAILVFPGPVRSDELDLRVLGYTIP